MIAHVVLFEPKATITDQDRETFLDVMKAAFREIPTVKRSMVAKRELFGAGYESKIGDQTYSYVCVAEFEDVDSLKAYLEHPLHQRLGQLFWQYCDRTLIVDASSFWLDDKEISNSRS
jgi:hypothetical protein